jgi:hypothetical protein
MDFVDEQGFVEIKSPVTQVTGKSNLGIRASKVLRWAFRTDTGTLHLNARLRRDAGLDEYEPAHAKLRRAPLIHLSWGVFPERTSSF